MTGIRHWSYIRLLLTVMSARLVFSMSYILLHRLMETRANMTKTKLLSKGSGKCSLEKQCATNKYS